MLKFLYLILVFFPLILFAQVEIDIDEDDLNVGGDIFEDFNADIEASQILEDERFYRYGRFFSFYLSVGLTTFDGNRGQVYENDLPSYGFGLNYFFDFQSSFNMGLAVSKHHYFIEQATLTFANEPGLVDVTALRVYFRYRYYIETANLGTAITYANPYFTLGMEYWILTNKFEDQPSIGDDTGGGLGFGVGFGLEFPIKLKKSYIGVEFLFHSVSFHDKFTQDLRGSEGPTVTDDIVEDLTGNGYTTTVSYVFNW